MAVEGGFQKIPLKYPVLPPPHIGGSKIKGKNSPRPCVA
jgi:hypothetical protein